MGQAFQIAIVFQKDWSETLLAKKVDPVATLLVHLQDELFGVQTMKKSENGCVLQVEGLDKDDVAHALDRALEEMDAANSVTLRQIKSIDALAVQQEPPESAQSEPTDAQETKDQSKSAPGAVSPAQAEPVLAHPHAPKKKESSHHKIQQLVGVEEFKALANEMTLLAPEFLRNDTWGMMSRRCYLFSIEDGCGFSTQCKLFSHLLEELSLGRYGTGVRDFAAELTLERMIELTEDAPSLCFISYDVSAWMGREQQPEFRHFLRALEKMHKRRVYAFRIPYVDKRNWRKMYFAIADIFMLHPVTTPPFTMMQLHDFAQKKVEDIGFTLSEAAWAGMEQHIIIEKSDGRFWGFNTMRKIIRSFLYEKQRNTAILKNTQNAKVLDEESIPTSLILPEKNLSAMEALDELIGIELIRERLLEVVSQIELSKITPHVSSPCLHMRFVGNPGTGKTTVARVLGKLLKERGLLSKGQFFEIAGRDLCGQYIGETAPKTAAICRDAYGSVLFIDEAYSLYRENNERDYGREAIDTLIAQMENHKEDFIVIMAGYQADMDTLLKANAGLESRIAYTVEFPNYDRKTLARIFMTMAKKNFTCMPDLQQAVEEYFAKLTDAVLQDAGFANARFVRNLFERTWGKAAVRHQVEPEQELILTAVDFEQATQQGEFKELQAKQGTRTIGFMP